MDNDEIKSAIRAGWDAMARTYQADSDISLDDIHYAPFAPGERYYKLLGDVSGKRVLEMACGGAQNSVTLSRWGADVVALDFSANQLRHALSLRCADGRRFRTGARRYGVAEHVSVRLIRHRAVVVWMGVHPRPERVRGRVR